MARDTVTAKNRNRRIRQEALREQLASQGHVQHVVEILKDLDDEDNQFDQLMLQRKKLVLDTKLKLIGKYLPDLKSTEITGDEDNPVAVSQPVIFSDASD